MSRGRERPEALEAFVVDAYVGVETRSLVANRGATQFTRTISIRVFRYIDGEGRVHECNATHLAKVLREKFPGEKIDQAGVHMILEKYGEPRTRVNGPRTQTGKNIGVDHQADRDEIVSTSQLDITDLPRA